MCGLLAFVAAPADGEPSRSAHATAAAIADASHLMRHRGPDEPGTWVDPAGTVVFGFNRLSIIDIAHSHQPL
ncbi:MAG: asparagine synthetase B, partial [Mycobacterium sp.]